MIRKSILLACALIAATGVPSLAHEGHGHTSSTTPEHYVLEPIHLAQFAAVVLAVGVLAWWGRHRMVSGKQRRG